jgi:hypothetical protein
MESFRPFVWTVSAVTDNAYNRKTEQAYSMLKKGFLDYIAADLRKQKALQLQQQLQGRQLTSEEQQQISQQVEQEIQQEIQNAYDKFINKNFKDVSEIMASDILQYYIYTQNFDYKTDDIGLFHAIISGTEIYYTGIQHGDVVYEPVNPLNFIYQPGSNSIFVEDAEWIVHWYDMTPTEIIRIYGAKLNKEQLEKIVSNDVNTIGFDFNNDSGGHYIRVYRVLWRGVEKIGFLYTEDSDDVILVDGTYRLDRKGGDIKVEWFWVPFVEECTRIGANIYVDCQPLQGQIRDIDDIYDVKMPYVGVSFDSINSKSTSIVDRMVPYQYMYDIVLSKLEKLIYSDEGKKLMMNYNMLPISAGLDIDKWIDYFRKNNIGFLNPNEEGNRGDPHVVNAVKEIDMSYAGQIQQYIMLLDYIERRMGEVVGITKEMEGIIHQRQAVANTQQAILQSSKILRPLFSMHDEVKRRLLKQILKTAKVAFMFYGKRRISYALNDLEMITFDIDPEVVDNEVYEIFIQNNDKLFDIKQRLEMAGQQALNAGAIDIDAFVKVMNTDSLKEVELILESALEKQRMFQQQIKQEELHAQQQLEEQKHQWKLEEIKLQGQLDIEKERIKSENAIKKQAMLSVGFNENKDVNKNKQLDVLEIAKKGINADIAVKNTGQEQNNEK